MKLSLLSLLLSFSTLCFSYNPSIQATNDSYNLDNFRQDLSTAIHHENNIVLRNFDGTNSSIYINYNFATLNNADGTQSTIYFDRLNSINLIALDGTRRTVTQHGSSSTVINEIDATQIFVNHSRTTSTCSQEDARHTINHNLGLVKRGPRTKRAIDVLIHMNWLMRKVNYNAPQEEISKKPSKLSKALVDNSSDSDNFKQELTTANHHDNYVVLGNFDGTNSTIYINYNLATLYNADGTQSTIYFDRPNSINLIALDGSRRTITQHGSSSTIIDETDASQIFVNHSRTTSTCSQKDARHTINHNLGLVVRGPITKRAIDVLIHMNWLIKKEVEKAIELEEQGSKEK